MTPRPPAWLDRLLEVALPGPVGAEVRADLEEGFRRRVESAGGSRLGATLWYVGQVARPDTFRLSRILRDRAGERTTTGGGGPMGDETRGGGGTLGRLADDFRFAARSLVRNPGYAVFACLTLALGIGATTAIFSAVESVLLRPFPYEASERMYVLMRPYGPSAAITPTFEEVEAWRNERDVFEMVEIATSVGKTLTGRGPAEGVRVGMVHPRLLEFLDVEPRLGRSFVAEDVRGEGRRVVLLSNHVWQSRFGGAADVLGETVALDGEPWTVIGVMPPRTPFPNGWDPSVDFWAPFPESATELMGVVLGVAREDVTAEEVQARLDLVQKRAVEAGEPEVQWGGSAFPLEDQLGTSVAEPLRILMAAVGLLLLIACVNVANLLLSRGTLRRHETAVRTALGAGRGRMVRQLLLEALLLGTAGALLGLMLAYGLVDAVRWLRPEDLAVLDEIRIDGRVLAFTMAVGALSGIIFGTLPAWEGSRPGSLDTLKSGTRLDREVAGGERFRWLLIGGEVALSFALLVGSVMAARALVELHGRDPGFRAEGLLAVQVTLPQWKYDEPEVRGELFRRFQQRMASVAGVEAVAVGSALPPKMGVWIGQMGAEGAELRPDRELIFGPYMTEGYLGVLEIPLLAGRTFTAEEHAEEAPVAILGETTARRLFGDADPVGRRITYGMATNDGQGEEEWVTVVGVAADIRMRGLKNSTQDELQHYRPMPDRWRSATFAVRLAAGAEPAVILPRLRQLLRAEEPDILFGDTAPVDDLMRETAARERFTSALLGVFAILALLLAAVGLYGVVSQTVGQRTREIGIRVSLGAAGADIRRLILGGGVRATALGILVGSGLAWAGMKALSSQIFGLDGQGVLSAYAASAAFLALVTLTACWIPARRAAGVDPVEALRRE